MIAACASQPVDKPAVTIAQVLKSAGYTFDNVDTLIKLRDHGISKGYIDALAAEGFKDLPASVLLKARDHGVGPGERDRNGAAHR